MTLNELLFSLLTLLLAFGASSWAGHRFGWLGYIGGFLAVLPGTVFILVIFGKMFYGPSVFPICREGKCPDGD